MSKQGAKTYGLSDDRYSSSLQSHSKSSHSRDLNKHGLGSFASSVPGIPHRLTQEDISGGAESTQTQSAYGGYDDGNLTPLNDRHSFQSKHSPPAYGRSSSHLSATPRKQDTEDAFLRYRELGQVMQLFKDFKNLDTNAVENQCMKLMHEETRIGDLEEKINGLETELEEERKKSEFQIKKIHDKFLRKSEELKKVETEKQDLLKRLSNEFGKKLTNNNPLIADLSDGNRPTKLAEKYHNLYEDQWTNAVEALESVFKIDEKDAIKLLLTILKECHQFSTTASEDQMLMLLNAFQNMTGQNKSRKTTFEDFSYYEIKNIKDMRYKMWDKCIPSLVQGFKEQSKYKNYFTNEDIQAYIKKCLEITWIMSLQDSPLTFGKELCLGDTIDGNQYKLYTRNGTKTEYVVFPPLLLQENGEVLCKGIVQPVSEKATSKTAMGTSDRNIEGALSSSYHGNHEKLMFHDTPANAKLQQENSDMEVLSPHQKSSSEYPNSKTAMGTSDRNIEGALSSSYHGNHDKVMFYDAPANAKFQQENSDREVLSLHKKPSSEYPNSLTYESGARARYLTGYSGVLDKTMSLSVYNIGGQTYVYYGENSVPLDYFFKTFDFHAFTDI